MVDTRELSEGIYALRTPMLRLAASLLRHPQDAEDAVSDAVVAMLSKGHTLRDDQALKPWALRITANCCYDLMRRAKRERDHSQPVEDGAALFEEPCGGSLFDRLRALPPPLFQVLVLYYYEGLSTAQIARVLGLSGGTVRVRLSRGRKRLKTLLEQEDEE